VKNSLAHTRRYKNNVHHFVTFHTWARTVSSRRKRRELYVNVIFRLKRTHEPLPPPPLLLLRRQRHQLPVLMRGGDEFCYGRDSVSLSGDRRTEARLVDLHLSR